MNGLKESPTCAISVFFLLFMGIVFVLNVIKKILIMKEYHYGNLDEHCQYLVEGGDGHTCSYSAYKKRFEENFHSCNGCPGKTFGITEAEAENRVIKGNTGKKIVVILANYCQAFLPYVSFLYTLLISMFIN